MKNTTANVLYYYDVRKEWGMVINDDYKVIEPKGSTILFELQGEFYIEHFFQDLVETVKSILSKQKYELGWLVVPLDTWYDDIACTVIDGSTVTLVNVSFKVLNPTTTALLATITDNWQEPLTQAQLKSLLYNNSCSIEPFMKVTAEDIIDL